MDLTKEMLSYLDGFADGYSRGYQDAVAAAAAKAPIIVRHEGGDFEETRHGSNAPTASNPRDPSLVSGFDSSSI